MLSARWALLLVATLAIGLLFAASADAAVLFEQSGETVFASLSAEYTSDQGETSQTADDFTVPDGTRWTISSVQAGGASVGGQSSQEVGVYFFADAGGLPATNPVYTEKVTMSTEDPNLKIALATPAIVGPGKFWLSVQVIAPEFKPEFSWTWSNTEDTGSPAAYRGPVGSCHTWGNRANCEGADSPHPGQAFTLSGESGPVGGGGGGPGGGNRTAPSNAFELGKLKLNRKKGTATLAVTVAAAGFLSVSGKSVAPSMVQAAAPGDVSLTIKAKGKAKKKLSKSGVAKLGLEVTFSPTGGTSASQSLSATLRKNKKKR